MIPSRIDMYSLKMAAKHFATVLICKQIWDDVVVRE